LTVKKERCPISHEQRKQGRNMPLKLQICTGYVIIGAVRRWLEMGNNEMDMDKDSVGYRVKVLREKGFPERPVWGSRNRRRSSGDS
ncbi:MAG: hypothetical protein LUG47_04065, partial [Clostridiales bacterium]|nr:hypothetical protein [Clostridiales bacterium]